MKKLKLTTKILIGALTALVGLFAYLFITKKPKTTSEAQSPIITGLPNEIEDFIVNQAKKIADALGTSPDSNIFQRMTENEVKAFEIISDNIDKKALIKLSYQSYTGRDLPLDSKEYLRSGQITELNNLGFYN